MPDDKQGAENEQLKHFFCKGCVNYFMSADWLEQHEIIHALCDKCMTWAEEIPTAKIRVTKGIAAAHGKHTGPKTEEGKAAGVEARKGTHTGPKTKAGKDRSRLNNYKHGLNSQTYTLLAPALPGKFPQCEGCTFRTECELKYKYCPVNVQPMLNLVRAYEENDIEAIRQIAGLQQVRAANVLEMMWHAIFKYGVLNPKVVNSKIRDSVIDGAGNVKEAKEEVVMEWMANPLLKRIPEFMELVGTTAEQNLMTVKAEQDQENLDGFLEVNSEARKAIKDHQNELIDEIKKLGIVTKDAAERRNADTALSDYNEQLDIESNK